MEPPCPKQHHALGVLKTTLPPLRPNPSTHIALLCSIWYSKRRLPHLSHILLPHLSRSDGRSAESGEQNEHSAVSLSQTHSCCDKARQTLCLGRRRPTSRVLSCLGHTRTTFHSKDHSCRTVTPGNRSQGVAPQVDTKELILAVYPLAREPSMLQHHTAQLLA